MGDQHISEEMVKLIFTPLRESLTDTTTAIKESSNELRGLLEAISKHPDKSDLKSSIDHLVETVKYDFTHKIQLLEVTLTTKLKEHHDEVISNINKLHLDVAESNKQISTILENSSKLSNFVNDLVDKVDKIVYVIGITFTIAMIAWGCLSFFFTMNFPGK